MQVDCHYCNIPAKLVQGDTIYPYRPDLHRLNFWHCSSCGAYVGCHKRGSCEIKNRRQVRHNGTEPLGILANDQLRRAKSVAHAAFDPIRNSLGISRTQAYKWLAGKMNLPLEKTHIGLFDMERCRQVVRICQSVMVENDQFN